MNRRIALFLNINRSSASTNHQRLFGAPLPRERFSPLAQSAPFARPSQVIAVVREYLLSGDQGAALSCCKVVDEHRASR